MEGALVGLTGIYGSGKTTVAKMFKRLGAVTVDADKLAHKALNKGSDTYKKILDVFGKGVLTKNGSIDRAKLAAVVFDDPRARKKLERIIHPPVLAEIEKKARASKKVMVADVPLLFESGFDKRTDFTVTVKTALKTIEKRLTGGKKNISRQEILRRIRAQAGIKEKAARSDFVIDNNGTLAETRKQVKEIWNYINKKERRGK